MTGYKGEVKSAIARAKRVLLAAGFPWSKTTGRYHPFASTQKTTHGVKVTRVGCSNEVALHVRWRDYESGTEARSERHLIEALAVATLREAGLPFDDRGWLKCG